ncbi:MAG TPA: hypothetical protein VFI13_14295, partial [Gemmatimonadales bacterium]|nr:hypothetical protein [Gemmatimonadales bacterium]
AMAEAIMRMLAKDPVDRWPGLEPAIEAVGHPERQGFNDPVRDELATLASSGSVPKILAASHTPKTPMPQSLRRPTGRTDPNAATIPVASGPQPGLPVRAGGMGTLAWAGLGGIAMVALLYFTGVLHLGTPAAPRAVDTVLVSAVNPTATPAPAPTTPPPASATPERPSAGRRRPAAGAAPAPATTATQPAATTPPPAAKPEPRAATPQSLGDPTTDTAAARQAIERLVERYRHAIETGRIDQVIAVAPALTDRQQHDFEQLFAKAEALQVELVIDKYKLEPSDRRAEVQVKGFFRYRERDGGANKLDDYRKKLNLAFAPTGWRITQVR